MDLFFQQVCLVDTLSQTHCRHPILVDIKYASRDNLTGRVIAGYEPSPLVQHHAVLGTEAAFALCDAQQQLNRMGMGLIIHDAYRPRRAVLDFLAWSQDSQPLDPRGQEMKAKHYPEHHRSELFDLGYFAEDSSHCYGNTVDVMLIDLSSQRALDLAAPFDFMGERSHLIADADDIGERAFQLRQTLQSTMTQVGFEPLDTEFWHFSYQGLAGRLSETPFDVPLTEHTLEQIQTRIKN